MKKVIILKGLPGSGKTTWAKKHLVRCPGVFKRINRDDLRAMFDNNFWNKENEAFAIQTRDNLIKEILKSGKSVIVDDTNLAPAHEPNIRQLVKDYCDLTGDEVEIEVKSFDVPLEECIKRDLKRDRSVGETVIRRMYSRFIETGLDRMPKYIDQLSSLPKGIICDLDGTIALLQNRHPFDCDKCIDDLLNEPVAEVVRNYATAGYTIIFLTGRMASFREATEKWLRLHNLPFDLLLMREEEDFRKDKVVKKELYHNDIEGKWNVALVLDDRDSVVHMWRKELGLLCLQVNYGSF